MPKKNSTKDYKKLPPPISIILDSPKMNSSSENIGLVVKSFGSEVEIEAQIGGILGKKFRCHLQKKLPDIVVGDNVFWEINSTSKGVITALLPRKNKLSKLDDSRKSKLIAANVDLIVIVFSITPRPYRNLIDRYLVAAEHASISPLLLISKSDLLHKNCSYLIKDLAKLYRSLNYRVIEFSRHIPETKNQLKDILKDRSSIFVGQSGVGKTSLINSLLPNINLRTGSLSRKLKQGMHTTSTTSLFTIPEGGRIIDSPGAQCFHFGKIMKKDVDSGFVEIRRLLGKCRFRNCRHSREPGCAILQALEKGYIHPERMKSYLDIIGSLK